MGLRRRETQLVLPLAAATTAAAAAGCGALGFELLETRFADLVKGRITG
jgi:hypothetical protein